MDTGIAFFRGINVGGKNILPMKELKSLMLELGYENVQTVIQSGNIVFNSKLPKKKLIEATCEAIFKRFGFKPKLIIFSADELKRIIDATPYQSKDGKHLHYFLMQNAPVSPDYSLLEKTKVTSEAFRLIGNVLYLDAPNGIARSKFAKIVEKAMAVPVTARNQNTLNKLVSKI